MYQIYNIHRRGHRISIKRKVYQYNISRDRDHVKHNHFNVVAYINVTTKQAVRLLRRAEFRIHLSDLYKTHNKFKGYLRTATYSKNSKLLTIQTRIKSIIVKREDYE